MKEKLLKILKEKAFVKKRIRLSSGKISNYYIDVRKVSLSPEGVYLISSLLWEIAKKDKVTAVGGPTLGADPIVAGICFLAYQRKRKLKGFLIRKTPKRHGQRKMIEGADLNKKDKVMIIDDVATTGTSLIRAIKNVKKTGAQIKRVVVVVDREEGAKQALLKMGYKLTSLFCGKDFL